MSTTPPQKLPGEEFRKHLFGQEAIARHVGGPSFRLAPELDAFFAKGLFDEVWQRPGLETRERSLVTIVTLTVLRAEGELAAHIAAGRRMGLSREAIVEAIYHLAYYAGLVTTHAGLAVADRVFAQEDADSASAE